MRAAVRPTPTARAALIALLCLPASAYAQGEAPSVRRHALPPGSAAPDAVVQAGRVHLVYGRAGDAFYQASDDGRSFTAPLRINRAPGEVFARDERGPKVAIGAGGTVHAVWSPERLLGVRYARLLPGQEQFEPTRELMYEGGAAAEGTAIAARGREVLVVWLDGQAGQPANSPVGLPLYGRVSRDGGERFSAAAPLRHDYGGGACACCHLDAAVDAAGRFVVAFRGARDSVRDLFLLRADERLERFATVRISEEEWRFQGCPMDGPRIGTRREGALRVAYTVDGQVASRGLGADGLTPIARPREPAGAGKYALALPGSDGRALFAWVDPDRRVRWELWEGDRRAQAGDAGELPVGTRPTGYVDDDGRFVLVF